METIDTRSTANDITSLSIELSVSRKTAKGTIAIKDSSSPLLNPVRSQKFDNLLSIGMNCNT